MPVTARRTALQSAVSHTGDASTRPTGRGLAKHRRSSKSATAPRAAAAVLSVGLAVSGGAALSVVAAPTTASAASTTAGQVRGSSTIASRPLIRFRDSGSTVKYIQKTLHLKQDRYFGNSTVAAVKKFQASWGIRVTGYMSAPTWNRLTWAARHGVLYGKGGAASSTTTTFRAKVLREAAKLKGTPYRYGGTTTKGFDCSGYTGYVYKKAGKTLPRTSRQQYSATKHISRSAAKPGDLVFFLSGGSGVYHVGIYAGANTLWHSSKPGKPIAKAKIWTSSVAFGRV
ncbi:NlpC/P60 family protein [Streptomyces sp. SID13031]|uniref:C40 family peptidase n=1 Tax=Streptomyces sp. SID13031 TaxID=2706046 RepID=UPI0013C618BF|nr:NlpC/P60 family protein [Streptomyces sp. SID13031]NEA35531.1 peptidoglycan endopeptidase [Streptomyces sp. SID13031]